MFRFNYIVNATAWGRNQHYRQRERTVLSIGGTESTDRQGMEAEGIKAGRWRGGERSTDPGPTMGTGNYMQKAW